MIRNTGKAERDSWDVLIVGGGIFGACAAYEAASRGLSVLLVERGDFAGATSANSFKVAHGGIRYMQHGDIARVRESSRERSALLRTVPHLVEPLPILIPTYGFGMKGKPVLRTGSRLYEWLTADRNRGISDPTRRIPSIRSFSRADTLSQFPGLPPKGLTGGIVFCDGQMYSPPRIALAYLRSAAECGAVLLNYAEVTGLEVEEGRVCGAVVHDRVGGRNISIRASVVLNAAGSWAGFLLRDALHLDLGPHKPVFSRDVGLITRRKLGGRLGLACPTETRDAAAVVDRGGRHLFMLPWREYTQVGVWHGVWSSSPDLLAVEPDELTEYVAEANRAYPGLKLRYSDICMVNTGLTLYGDEDETKLEHHFGNRSLLFDHAAQHGLEGIVTLIGVRFTVARGMAERAIELVFRKLGRDSVRSVSENLPVWGGDFDDFSRLVDRIVLDVPHVETVSTDVAPQIAHNYGSRYADIFEIAREDSNLAIPYPGSATLPAQVVYAVRSEMAVTLEDVLCRRTDLGTAEEPETPVLESVAADMATELGWDDGRIRQEINAVRDFFLRRGAKRDFSAQPPLVASHDVDTSGVVKESPR